MRILITNHSLDGMAGTETATYTLALALRGAGHEVLIATAAKGFVAEVLGRQGVEVTENMAEWGGREFDVIHAQHNTMALVAGHYFPRTPMVFQSHGVIPELEQPPSIDLGIAAYIAVSEEVRDSLERNHGLDNVVVVRNGIDCRRFRPKLPVRERPERVLVISNHFENEVRSVVSDACRLIGADLRIVGWGDEQVWNTEEAINGADMVISLGRGALEAMACGRAVLIFDHHGGDGFVIRENYEEIRKFNFSGRRFGVKYTAEGLADAMRSYASAMGETNRELALEHHDIGKLLEQYLSTYRKAVDAGPPGAAASIPAREVLFYQKMFRNQRELESMLKQQSKQHTELLANLAALKSRVENAKLQLEQEKRNLREQQRKFARSAVSQLSAENQPRSPAPGDIPAYNGENLVFIIGPPRSGTTWILSLLKEHPDVLAATMDTLGVRVNDAETLETGIFLEDRGLSDSQIKERFFSLSQANPGKIIVEKTPIHTFYVHRIRSIFPLAAVLLVERDGRDVAASMVEVARDKDAWWRGAPKTVAEAAMLWRQYAEAALEVIERYKPCLVRYEDLLNDPHAELKRVLSILGLGIEHADNHIEASRKGKNILIKGVFRKGLAGGWKHVFSKDDVETFKAVAGGLLLRRGYVQDDSW
jgi:glycosyltransferase involved in cell wall biosynthesis